MATPAVPGAGHPQAVPRARGAAWKHLAEGRGIRSWALLLAAYLAVALVTLGANPFRGESITPLDMLIKQPAFAWIDPGLEMRQRERSDILDALLPSWMNAREQVRSGHFPKWNDVAAGGATFVVPTYSLFTPAFAVFAAAPSPALGFHLAIALNLALAGLGMHLFLRRHVGLPASICGAVTFMFCGFHAAWLYWPHVHTAIWAPWLLLAIDRCVARPRLGNAIAVAVATALVLLGGFPFVAELILCAGGLYFLVSWACRLRSAQPPAGAWPLAWYGLGCALGLLLCAPLLIGLADWLQQFDLGYRQNRGSYLRLEHATRLLPPWAYEFKRVEQTMYVGVLLTACAAVMLIATLLAPLLRKAAPPPLAIYGASLLVIASGLVFGLWPMWLIGWFPGMSFNSWSRAIGILDIAIITLGACAIDALWRRAANRRAIWLRALVLLLVLAQLAETTAFFRRYNGATPAAHFYPELPAVERVRTAVGPFDYVAADRSFGFAGVLGAYGLRDWFAHQLRTPAHKQVLDDMVPAHRASHTASRYKASDIRMESQALADFNVRYLLVADGESGVIGPGRDITRSRALPAQPGAPWHQRFQVGPEGMALRAVSIRLATYRESDLGGRVTLDLQSPDGSSLARSTIDAGTVVDNRMAEFRFAAPVELAAGMYRFTVHYDPADTPPRRLTAWSTPAAGRDDGLLSVGATPHAGVLQYLLHVEAGTDGPFRRVFAGAGIAVLENTRAPNGPYFLSSLDDPATRDASRPVTMTRYRPDAFAMRYDGNAAGYVVVPTGFNENWEVAVDGRRVAPSLKAGVMPAVPVDGPATIVFAYRVWPPGAWLAWLTFLSGFLGLMVVLARRSRPR